MIAWTARKVRKCRLANQRFVISAFFRKSSEVTELQPSEEAAGTGYSCQCLTHGALSCSYCPLMEPMFGKPVEVEVRDSLEKALKILKQKMSKEGILQELKRRRFYEKPSVKRKRKRREARKRLRREMKRRNGR